MPAKIPEVKSISGALNYYSGKTPEKTYITYNGLDFTYSKTNSLVNSVCFLLESLGLKKGEIVSAVIKNSIEYIVLYLASLRYGCIFNPYPSTLETKDILRYLKNVNPKIIFYGERHHDDLQKNTELTTYAIKDGFIDDLKPSEKIYPDFIPEDNSPACIYYSSGTTGNPKSIVFSHKNMIANISSIIRGFRFNADAKHLIILPLGHTASTNYSFLPCTLCGGTMVVAESFWKIRAELWNSIKKHKINYIEVVPSILVALLNTPYNKADFENITTLPFVGCGSSTLSKELQIKFAQKFGIKVANLYGLSETGPTHIDYPLEKGWEPGSVGKPLDVNEVRVVDENDNFLKPREVGEIVIKGENVFIDYYKNHSLYENVVKNGYFHTGDLGYIDENDRLFFTGRKKDLIIKGGVNISPDEIDEILYEIDEIKEAVTVGVSDQYLGEKIISFISVKEGKSISQEKVLDFCKKYISRDKFPDKIIFVDNLPKGPSNKILRRKLRETYNEK